MVGVPQDSHVLSLFSLVIAPLSRTHQSGLHGVDPLSLLPFSRQSPTSSSLSSQFSAILTSQQ